MALPRTHSGGCVLPSSPEYYIAWDVASESTRQEAISVLDNVRPHALGHPTFRLVFVNNRDDARILSEYLPWVPLPIGFDFETRGWSPKGMPRESVSGGMVKTRGISPRHPERRAMPVTFQISWGDEVYVVLAEYLYFFRTWIQSCLKIDYANSHFEGIVFLNVGIRMPRIHRDCIALDFLLEETLRQRAHGLKDLSRDYLGVSMPSFEDTFKNLTFEDVLISDPLVALSYAGQDALCTTLVCDVLENLLRQRPARDGYDSYELYQHWERSFHSGVQRMQFAGIPLSRTRLAERHDELERSVDELDGAAYALLGRTINLSSTRTLSRWYYGECGRPVALTTPGYSCLLCDKAITKRTDYVCRIHGKGALVNTPSLNDEVLDSFAKSGDELAALLQRRRTLEKNRSTWMDGFYRLSTEDGWGYPTIRSCHVVSGRLAAGIWLTTPGVLRDVFAFPEDDPRIFLRLDYSQLELRLLAHVSGDPNMLQAFLEGRDLHCWTAGLLALLRERGEAALGDAELKSDYYDLVYRAKEASDLSQPLSARDHRFLTDRKVGKAVNFGIAYGQSPTSLSTKLGITVDEAEKIYEAVWSMYSRVREYYEESIARTTELGEMRTLLGRNRKIPQLASSSPGNRKYGERLVKNTPCQAGGADVIRAAMILVDMDVEAGEGCLDGTRGAYGDWVEGSWVPDWDYLPKGWRDNLPEAFARAPGELGRLGFRLSLQVHDELLLFGPPENAEAAGRRARELMENPFGADLEFSVPLSVSVGTGKNWDEAK